LADSDDVRKITLWKAKASLHLSLKLLE
jgi:hypothetical protein